MRKTYEFHPLDRVEKLFIEHLLMDQIEQQTWFICMRSEILGYDRLICVQ